MYTGSFVQCTSYDICDSNDFKYLVIVYFDHIRSRLSVYIAFVCLFAYHIGKEYKFRSLGTKFKSNMHL